MGWGSYCITKNYIHDKIYLTYLIDKVSDTRITLVPVERFWIPKYLHAKNEIESYIIY